jgi:hypothetical protein
VALGAMDVAMAVRGTSEAAALRCTLLHQELKRKHRRQARG